jgi:hypothetical protein
MKAAASELLHQEASQVDQEMEELLAEMALVSAVEARLADFTQHFFTLLARRGNIVQRALGMHEADFFAIFKPSSCLDAPEDHTNDHARRTSAAG